MFVIVFKNVLTTCYPYIKTNSTQEVVEMDIPYGKIKGVFENGVTSFYGIPFASPPIGDLRFAPPQLPKPWHHVWDCTYHRPFQVCPQFHITKNLIFGKEDCLYMDVFMPGKPDEKTSVLPVMFWIYGIL